MRKVTVLDWQPGGGGVLRIDEDAGDEHARRAAVCPTDARSSTWAHSPAATCGPVFRPVGPLIVRVELQAAAGLPSQSSGDR
jgi:hypothetical protein